MKLCVDVGNTTIGLGFYQNDEMSASILLNTDINKMEDEYYSQIEFLLSQRKIDTNNVKYIIYSSVVPSLNEILTSIFKKLFSKATFYKIESDDKFIKMDTDNPRETGTDLIADLVGAKEKYQCPLIIIDLGTATKLLLLDKDEKFTSALIMPGLKVSSDSLFKKAALLPEVDLMHSTSLLDSKNTTSCIKHGIVFGHIESIVGLARRYEEEIGYKLTKIVTGGALNIIKEHLPKDYIIDPTLTLDGELYILNYLINNSEE